MERKTTTAEESALAYKGTQEEFLTMEGPQAKTEQWTQTHLHPFTSTLALKIKVHNLQKLK